MQFKEFLLVVFAGQKQPKQVGKMLEIWRKFNFKVMTTFHKKFGKIHNCEVSSLGLGIFYEVSVWKF